MSYFWKQEGLQRTRCAHGDRWQPVETGSIKLRRTHTDCEGGNVTVKLVVTGDEMRAACDLINDRYGWRGCGANHRLRVDAHHLTLTAKMDDAMVRTITLAVDSPHGLAVDNSFRDAINRFRAQPSSRVTRPKD